MTKDEFFDKYKEGDFIVFDRWMVIFSGFTEPDPTRLIHTDNHAIIYYALMLLGDTNHVSLSRRTGIGYIEDYKEYEVRLATNFEKRSFYKMLKDHNCEWDANSMQLIVHTRGDN